MKKGSFVTFNRRGVITTALVSKVGRDSTLTVLFKDGDDLVQVKAPTVLFTPTEAIKMDSTSTAMDCYSISGYKEAGGEETIRFQANLLKNGKKVAVISNSGIGGPNDYHHVEGARGEIQAFHDACKQWATDHNTEEMIEPDSSWVFWTVFGKNELETAEEMFRNYTQSMSEYK